MLCLHITPLLVLVLGVSLGAALPQHTPRRGCSLLKYQKLVPDNLKAVQKMQEEFVSIVGNRGCGLDPSPGRFCPQLPDRVVLAEAELDFTTTMLQFPTRPSFAEMHQEALAFLAQAREDLRGCPLSLQVAPAHQPSGKLRHWLQKLQVAMKTETIPCLQGYAMHHVFEVLQDLKCAALQEQWP
ncbi:IFNL3 protein, partial [Sapayoa aenigma]|nr:IFNL3 protein [Sapayoa aenigma]